MQAGPKKWRENCDEISPSWPPIEKRTHTLIVSRTAGTV